MYTGGWGRKCGPGGGLGLAGFLLDRWGGGQVKHCGGVLPAYSEVVSEKRYHCLLRGGGGGGGPGQGLSRQNCYSDWGLKEGWRMKGALEQAAVVGNLVIMVSVGMCSLVLCSSLCLHGFWSQRNSVYKGKKCKGQTGRGSKAEAAGERVLMQGTE